MGGVFSSLQGAVKTGKAVIKVLRDLSAEYSELLDRAGAAPSLPVPNPTTAYWQENPPFPELVDIRSEKLPENADVVIIGSGITGAAIARTILHEGRRTGKTRRVVVCEARTLCSGATGRNGGHIKASPHEMFGRFRKRMGPERAAALTRFQLKHLETLVELCEAEGIDVAECREVETVDLCLDEESYEKVIKEAKEVNEWVPEFPTSTWTAEEAQAVSSLIFNNLANASHTHTEHRNSMPTTKSRGPSPIRPEPSGHTGSSLPYGKISWTNSQSHYSSKPPQPPKKSKHRPPTFHTPSQPTEDKYKPNTSSTQQTATQLDWSQDSGVKPQACSSK